MDAESPAELIPHHRCFSDDGIAAVTNSAAARNWRRRLQDRTRARVQSCGVMAELPDLHMLTADSLP